MEDKIKKIMDWINNERLYQKEQGDKYHKSYWSALDKIEKLIKEDTCS